MEPRSAGPVEMANPVRLADAGLQEQLEGLPLMSPQSITRAVGPAETSDTALQAKLKLAMRLTWAANIALLIVKAFAYWASSSKAVLASLVDSVVDLLSQGVIAYAEMRAKRADPRFPVGKARLETMGVLGCACIMIVSTTHVVEDAANALYVGLKTGTLPELDGTILMYCVLASATLAKLVCYRLCVVLQKYSDSMMALAEDHLNDVISNTVAAVTVAVATSSKSAWWVDPAGGIAISLFILWRWFIIIKEQADKIVGLGAPEDVLQQLKDVALSHHTQLEVDSLRAYHTGSRYTVELEVVIPEGWSVKAAHDTSLALQVKLEALPLVERAFVHVDYARRETPEHRTERELAGLPLPLAQQPLLAHDGSNSTGSDNAV